MTSLIVSILVSIAATTGGAEMGTAFQSDTLKTPKGDLVITFFGHASLLFEFGGKIMYVDPCNQFADYSRLPKADLVLVTHHHGDHFDPKAIGTLTKSGTIVLLTKACGNGTEGGIVMQNGETRSVVGVSIQVVPAYNLVHKRENGVVFHPKGEGNGYVISFGGLKVYVAGDTENIPEMKALKGIDCAFLPMNLPYTMTPEMVADAARAFKPKILYPYHFGETETQKIVDLLRDVPAIEVRIRNMK